MLTNYNGFIFVTDVCGAKETQSAEHVKFRSKKTYEQRLTENGIEIIAVLPIYYLLNRAIFGKIHHFGIKLDDLFAPVYYYLDSFLLSHSRSNLKLIIGRKVKL